MRSCLSLLSAGIRHAPLCLTSTGFFIVINLTSPSKKVLGYFFGEDTGDCSEDVRKPFCDYLKIVHVLFNSAVS
jgi:hypothetical protein